MSNYPDDEDDAMEDVNVVLDTQSFSSSATPTCMFPVEFSLPS